MFSSTSLSMIATSSSSFASFCFSASSSASACVVKKYASLKFSCTCWYLSWTCWYLAKFLKIQISQIGPGHGQVLRQVPAGQLLENIDLSKWTWTRAASNFSFLLVRTSTLLLRAATESSASSLRKVQAVVQDSLDALASLRSIL